MTWHQALHRRWCSKWFNVHFVQSSKLNSQTNRNRALYMWTNANIRVKCAICSINEHHFSYSMGMCVTTFVTDIFENIFYSNVLAERCFWSLVVWWTVFYARFISFHSLNYYRYAYCMDLVNRPIRLRHIYTNIKSTEYGCAHGNSLMKIACKSKIIDQ